MYIIYSIIYIYYMIFIHILYIHIWRWVYLHQSGFITAMCFGFSKWDTLF